jgi:hypothetical protein
MPEKVMCGECFTDAHAHFRQQPSPLVESVTDRFGPPALIFMVRAQADAPAGAMSDDAVEILIHLVHHVVRIALDHGAPTDPRWWDHIADDLAALADTLRAQQGDDTRSDRAAAVWADPGPRH